MLAHFTDMIYASRLSVKAGYKGSPKIRQSIKLLSSVVCFRELVIIILGALNNA